MGEELQSHVKIKVGPLPLLRLFHTVPHLPELESFCQDESPQDTPVSSPLPVRRTSFQPPRAQSGSRDASDQSRRVIMLKILRKPLLPILVFTSITLIQEFGDNSTMCV